MNTPTPLWITGITFALAVTGLVLGLWALVWNRARGRLRCPKCWYDMRGAKAGKGGLFTCPECGRSALTDKSLRRTRRRWRWAGLALILLAGAVALTATRKDGPLSLIPTWLLVRLPGGGEVDWFDDRFRGETPNHWRAWEFWRREPDDLISTGAMRHWLGRVEGALRADGRYGFSEAVVKNHQCMRDTIMPRSYVDAPLKEVLADFDQVTGLKILADWDDLSSMGLTRATLVTAATSGLSAAHALDEVLKRAVNGLSNEPAAMTEDYLTWTCTSSGVRVGSASTLFGDRKAIIYPVDDLVDPFLRSEFALPFAYFSDDELRSEGGISYWLMFAMYEHIQRSTGWRYIGCSYSPCQLYEVEIIAGLAVVDAVPDCHIGIGTLLEQLDPSVPHGTSNASRKRLNVLRARMDRLAGVVVPSQPGTISTEGFFELIDDHSPYELVIDWEALEEEGIRRTDEAHLPASDASLPQLLQHYVQQAGDYPYRRAAWVLRDEQLIVTNDEGEFYSREPLAHDIDVIMADGRAQRTPDASETIVEAIIDAIDPLGPTWDIGVWGEAAEFAGTLIVHTAAGIHVRIDDLITRLRRVLIDGDQSLERSILQTWRTADSPPLELSEVVLYDVGDLIDQYLGLDAAKQMTREDAAWEITESITSDVYDPKDERDAWDWSAEHLPGIRSVGDVLVIRNTPKNHLAVDDYLTSLRQ